MSIELRTEMYGEQNYHGHPNYVLIWIGLLVLSEALDVPLRERNTLLEAAGYAPGYQETDLFSPEMEPVKRTLAFMLERHEPYPAIVMDRHWNLLMANAPSRRLTSLFVDDPETICGSGPLNAMLLVFHPRGMRRFITNWDTVAAELIRRLRREAATSGRDEAAQALLQQILSYADRPRLVSLSDPPHPPAPFIPLRLRRGEVQLEFFTTMTSLGTAQDITLQELRIETYFSADEQTKRHLKEWMGT